MHSMPDCLQLTYRLRINQRLNQHLNMFRPVTVEDTDGQYEQMRDQSDHEEEKCVCKIFEKML